MIPPICPLHKQTMQDDGWTADEPPWKRWRCTVKTCSIQIEKPVPFPATAPTANLQESTKASNSTDESDPKA